MCLPNVSLFEPLPKNFVDFFNKYASDLRRTGIRSIDDIRKEFENLELISDTLRGVEPSELLHEAQKSVVSQVVKLMRSTSKQETVVGVDKKEREAKKKAAKDKEKEEKEAKKKAAKDKEKAEKKEKKNSSKKLKDDAAATTNKVSTPRQGSIPPDNADVDGFEVQNLNMADFLGS